VHLNHASIHNNSSIVNLQDAIGGIHDHRIMGCYQQLYLCLWQIPHRISSIRMKAHAIQ
jgi:hypothetical protein